MIIIEDTRQQAGKHTYKHEYWTASGIPVRRQTLSVGDYQAAGDGSVAIDTKKDILELVGNVQFSYPTKAKISGYLDEAVAKYDVSPAEKAGLFDIIWEDDTNRDVETEITQFVYRHKINEGAVKPLIDVYIKRRGRFHRELVRAQIEGVKLYILVENVGGLIKGTRIEQPYISKLSELHKWVNPRMFRKNKTTRGGKKVTGQPMRGVTLMKACMTMEKKYGCKFIFCKPEDAGAVIYKCLQWNMMQKKRKEK